MHIATHTHIPIVSNYMYVYDYMYSMDFFPNNYINTCIIFSLKQLFFKHYY